MDSIKQAEMRRAIHLIDKPLTVIATEIGINETTLYKFMSNRDNISKPTLTKIAEYLCSSTTQKPVDSTDQR